jgi:hypothetical protein
MGEFVGYVLAGLWMIWQIRMTGKAFANLKTKGQQPKGQILAVIIFLSVITVVPLLFIGFISLGFAGAQKDLGHGGSGGNAPWR